MTDKNRVNFDTDVKNLDDAYLIPNPVWTLKEWDFSSVETTERYLFMNEFNLSISNYSNEDMKFTFIMERRPLYFMMNNIFPALILNCITLLSYALPFSMQIGLSIIFRMIFLALINICLRIWITF
jgi:hypothetical protein